MTSRRRIGDSVVYNSDMESQREASAPESTTGANAVFTFSPVWIAYEGGAPIAPDAGPLTFRDILPDFEGGNWFVALNPQATLAFAGYPANVYQCERAERSGYLDFFLATSGYTNVHGGVMELAIDMDGVLTSEDVQAAEHLYPYDTWSPFDEHWRFGPNGKQVLALIDWWRSKLDKGEFDVLKALQGRYRARANLKWPKYPDQRWGIHDVGPAASWLPWRRGKSLAHAWFEAMFVASRYDLWWAARYVAAAAPGLVAVALRSVLEPKYFDELYSDMNEFYPLSTLDAEISPVGYKR